MTRERPNQFRADERHALPPRPAAKRRPQPGGRERVQRCLEILRLLTAGQQWPATRLSQAFDVSTRTIRRDMELLENAGFVLRTGRGRPVEYRLAREATREQPQWSLGEVVALLSLAGRMSDGVSESERAVAFTAVAKLVGLQPAAAGKPLTELLALLAAQAPAAGARLCGLPWLGRLIEALIDHRALRVRLHGESGPAGSEPLVIVPTAVGLQSGQWVISAYKVHGSELVTVEPASVASVEFDVQAE